jgi:Flp pilus assembly protein TadD
MLDTSEVSSEAGSLSTASAAGTGAKALFLEKVRQSNAACGTGDFALAVRLYTEAIALDPANHILFSNRSAAHIKMGGFAKALQDAVRARELNPEWPKVTFM